MKNWDPLVFLPALAMDRRPGSSCTRLKFSSKGERKLTNVLQIKALGISTFEFLAIDGPSTGAVAPGEITALKHELGDHTVEAGTRIAETVLASRQFSEVFCGFGDDFIIQLENDSTSRIATDGDVKLWEGKGKKKKGHHEKRNWHGGMGRT
jgi:hypothetical protein